MWDFRQIRISVKIKKNLAILGKIFENIDYGEDFRNTSILVKLSKSSILDKIFENLYIGRDFRNTSILVKLFENIVCGQYLRKIPILVKIFESSRFWWNLR